MTATVTNIRREIDLRSTSWDGLWLRYRDARLTVDDLDQRFREAGGEWLNPHDEQASADADALMQDIGKEARRRLQHLIGPALRFDDIMEMIG